MIVKTDKGYAIVNSKGKRITKDDLTLIEAKRKLRFMEDFSREIMYKDFFTGKKIYPIFDIMKKLLKKLSNKKVLVWLIPCLIVLVLILTKPDEDNYYDFFYHKYGSCYEKEYSWTNWVFFSLNKRTIDYNGVLKTYKHLGIAGIFIKLSYTEWDSNE
jgi:hypothetical protein